MNKLAWHQAVSVYAVKLLWGTTIDFRIEKEVIDPSTICPS